MDGVLEPMKFGDTRLAFVRSMYAPDTRGETVPVTVTTALEAVLPGEAGTTIQPPLTGVCIFVPC